MNPLQITMIGMAGLMGTVGLAQPQRACQVGEATARLEPGGALSGLSVTIHGVTFHPFAQAAVIGAEGKPDPHLPLDVDLRVVGNAFALRLTSADPAARGVSPGHVEGLGDWRRLDLSQHCLAYGQTWWQKTTYSAKGDFWFSAHWVMESSNGASWKALNLGNQGTGPFPAALQVDYAPDTAGRYLPLREMLELRVGGGLWDVVPFPRPAPSEYREFIADAVELDLWGGKAEPELRNLLEVMRAVGRGRLQFLTMLQNWEVGGWDALLPDSVMMPDFPPNAAVGTVPELRRLCELGRSMGRFGFRTNYRVLRQNSPSFLRNRAHFALGPDGKPLDYLRSGDWPTVAGRQEKEIQQLFRPNAGFTDQMTSGAAPWAWHDFGAQRGSRSMSQTLRRQQALARLIRRTQRGPLGSETLMDQQLLGEYVDCGDFGVMDGHHRLFSPEFKLRRLQALTGFHGMGLMYRFYEMPPYDRYHSQTTTFGGDPAQLDDYRACEVMFGNGAYVCYPFANWRYWLVEALLIGHLQKRYALQPVKSITYRHGGQWLPLEEMVRAGIVPNPDPWSGQPTSEFGQVRVAYESGLTVVVNRLAEPLAVPEALPRGMILPRSGWVAWTVDGTFVAFSAPWPQTDHRVDYLRDDAAQVEFLDPRGAAVRGVDKMTLWERGRPVIVAEPEAKRLWVEGAEMRLGG